MKRRDFLQYTSLGAATTLLSPILRQLHAQAEGKAPPMRFIFFMESNGRNSKHYQPSGNIAWKPQTTNTNQRLADVSLGKSTTLPAGIKPLEAYRDRLTIIQGLSSQVCNGGSHSANFGALGCYDGAPPGSESHVGKALDETIDAALGRALPGSVFRQLVLGVSKRQSRTVAYNASASGPNQPLATICDPTLAYSSIFGSVADGAARKQFMAKSNLLDFMVGKIKEAESRLGSVERQKFEHHLAAYESLRQRQSRLNEIESTLKKVAPPVSDKYQSVSPSDRLDAHADMAAAALIGGLTNVVTLASGTGGAHMGIIFKELGITTDKHALGHNTPNADGTPAEQCLDIIQRFHTNLLVRLMKKLEAVPEGNGTMLDNTLVLYMSDAADDHHPGFEQWPLALIGNLGGRLKTGGRFLGYPRYGRKGHCTMADLYLTFLHAAGTDYKSFGAEDTTLRSAGHRHAPLAELLG